MQTTQANSSFARLPNWRNQERISRYFYAIFTKKRGGNSETIAENAWITHDDLFDSRVDMMLSQFQVSDLTFPRETQLT